MHDLTSTVFGITYTIPAYAYQLVLAAILGMLVGMERAWQQKAASVRTFSLICTGSCLFALLSTDAAGSIGGGPYDVTRVAAGIVTGIGFVGGGVIFKTKDRIEGITTGAMLWLVAGLGMACGFNEIGAALWAFFVYLFIISFGKLIHRVVDYFHPEVE